MADKLLLGETIVEQIAKINALIDEVNNGEGGVGSLNIENGSGNGSIQQKVLAENDPNRKTLAKGRYSSAFNRNTKALQYGCFANGGDTVAGQTREEFNEWIRKYDGTSNAGHTFYYNNGNNPYVVMASNPFIKYDYERYESYAMATGDGCKAKGRGCFAGGVFSEVKEGYGAGAFGWQCIVETNGLHPSFATGANSISIGNCLYNIGFENELNGNYAFSLGWGLKSTNENANAGKVLLGRFNEDLSPTYNAYSILELGDGKDDKNRYNVFHIYKKSVDKWKDSSNYNAELKSALTVYEALTAKTKIKTSSIESGETKNTVISDADDLAIGENVNIYSKTSKAIGTGIYIYGNERNYSFGDNITIGKATNTSTTTNVGIGVVCEIYGSGVFEFGAGLKAEGDKKTVLGRFNAEINWTNTNYTDGRGTYSVFEVGDGGYYDNDTKLHRFNVLQIYKNYKNAFGTVANDDGNTAIYTAELKADLVAYGKRATFDYMTCYQKPSLPTDVVRLQDIQNLGGTGGTQLFKHSISVFGSTLWQEIIIINTSSDNLKDKQAESNFPDLLKGMVAISGRSMGSTQYTILGYIESVFYLSYTDIALIVYDENDSSERIKKISIRSDDINSDTVTLV